MGALIGRVWARARGTGGAEPAGESTGAAMLWGALLANAPDIDLVVALHGRADYLDHHRGFTHSLVALPFFAALAAWLLRRYRGRESFARYGTLAFAAILSHLLADLSGSYGIFIFSPLNSHRYRLDWMFVIDGIVIALCGTSVAAALFWRTRGRSIARAGLLALGFYAAGCAGIHAVVLKRWRDRLAAAGPVPARLAAVPQIGGPCFWLLLADDGKTTTVAALTLGPQLEPGGKGLAARYLSRFRRADDLQLKSFVSAARARPDDPPLLRSFLDFARFPTYWETHAGTDCASTGGYLVHWRDLQYGWDPQVNPFHLVAQMNADGRATRYALAGALFDPDAGVAVVPPREPPQNGAVIPCDPQSPE